MERVDVPNFSNMSMVQETSTCVLDLEQKLNSLLTCNDLSAQQIRNQVIDMQHQYKKQFSDDGRTVLRCLANTFMNIPKNHFGQQQVNWVNLIHVLSSLPFSDWSEWISPEQARRGCLISFHSEVSYRQFFPCIRHIANLLEDERQPLLTSEQIEEIFFSLFAMEQNTELDVIWVAMAAQINRIEQLNPNVMCNILFELVQIPVSSPELDNALICFAPHISRIEKFTPEQIGNAFAGIRVLALANRATVVNALIDAFSLHISLADSLNSHEIYLILDCLCININDDIISRTLNTLIIHIARLSDGYDTGTSSTLLDLLLCFTHFPQFFLLFSAFANSISEQEQLTDDLIYTLLTKVQNENLSDYSLRNWVPQDQSLVCHHNLNIEIIYKLLGAIQESNTGENQLQNWVCQQVINSLAPHICSAALDEDNILFICSNLGHIKCSNNLESLLLTLESQLHRVSEQSSTWITEVINHYRNLLLQGSLDTNGEIALFEETQLDGVISNIQHLSLDGNQNRDVEFS